MGGISPVTVGVGWAAGSMAVWDPPLGVLGDKIGWGGCSPLKTRMLPHPFGIPHGITIRQMLF